MKSDAPHRKSNLITGTNAQLAGGATGFAGFTGLWHGTDAAGRFLMPTSGTLRNLFVKVDAAPGGADAVVYTVMVNGGATALTTTITGAATDNSDTTNVITIEEGDAVSIRAVATATAAASRANIAMLFEES